jgi:hypothetical protein
MYVLVVCGNVRGISTVRAARREAIILGYHFRAARLTEPNLQQQHLLYVPVRIHDMAIMFT